MESNEKIFVAILIAVTLIIVTAICSGVYKSIRMAELGYEETTVVGYAGTVWKKSVCDNNNINERSKYQ